MLVAVMALVVLAFITKGYTSVETPLQHAVNTLVERKPEEEIEESDKTKINKKFLKGILLFDQQC